jgi:hypothetical protein
MCPTGPELGVILETAMSHLSPQFSGALRTFAYWVATGSLGLPLLDGVDYRATMLEEPSLMEMAFAIFANVIELDAAGKPVNAKYAEHRAAQYVRGYCDPTYDVSPDFEDWEMALHQAPALTDDRPWPHGHEQ